jgi:hypothetical protein
MAVCEFQLNYFHKYVHSRLSASHRYPRLLNQLAMISRNDGTW